MKAYDYINVEQLKKHRHYIHQFPEIGLDVAHTAQYITSTLDKLGITYQTVLPTKTGVIAYFPSKIKNSETIAIRCDTDALEIEEETGLSYASTTKGLMHACGHDGHTAIALGLCEVLTKLTLKKNVVVIFQPGEENPGGAKPIVDTGIFEQYNIKSIFGLHLNPYIKEGSMSINPGATLAKCCVFSLTVTGKSAHGTMPESGIDALLIACELVVKLNEMKNKMQNKDYILHVQKIEGGSNNSIIAETVNLLGTIRTFDDVTYSLIKQEGTNIISGLIDKYHCGIIWNINETFSTMYPVLVNDPKLVEALTSNIKDIPLYGGIKYYFSEDFAYYLTKVRGVFAFLGTKTTKYCAPLHSNKFNFNEDVLAIGVKYFLNVLCINGCISED
jgi:amidohydrolase